MAHRQIIAIVALLWMLQHPLSAQTAAMPQRSLHDTQAWLLLLGFIPVGDQTLLHVEAQPRWNQDVSHFDSALLRVGVGRRVGARATVWAGYGYIPRFLDGDDVLHEQRVWEQLMVTLPRAAGWAPSLRFRLEQRFLDQWPDASHRVRGLVRAIRPIGTTPWSIAVSDEYFQTLDDTTTGPRSGFDQNRAFAGVLRRFSRALTLEAGYMWQFVPRTPSLPARNNHTAVAWLMYAPPVAVRQPPPQPDVAPE